MCISLRDNTNMNQLKNFNMLIFGIIAMLNLQYFGVKSQVEEFQYFGDKSPEHWPELYPTCGDEQQSPIALSTCSAVTISVRPIEFIHYDFSSGTSTVLNTGNSAQVTVTLPKDRLPLVRGGALPNEFKLHQFHFHWGRKSNRGSEHTIDGKRFPMEMHIVQVNTKYDNFNTAFDEFDGIAVISVLFKLSKIDNPGLQPLIEALPRIREEGDTTTLKRPVEFAKLLPWDLSSFFMYNGSFTTPTCHEPVLWRVFDTFVPVSERQLEVFRDLEGIDGVNIEDNYRPLQELNNRTVYKSKSISSRFKFCHHPYCKFYEKLHACKYEGIQGWKKHWL